MLATPTNRRESPEAAIQRLYAVMKEASEGCHDTFNPTIDKSNVLVVDLGSKGQYSVQADEGELLMFSPISGPAHYVYDVMNAWWYHPSDGHLMDEKLVREMMHTTSVYLNL